MLNERPWLPYALVVEPSQLEELKRRRLQLRAELTVPVPLVSRTDFHEGVSPAELYFLSHRGLERFYSEEKIEQYRIKIRSELRAIEEKLHLLVEQEQRARDLVGRLEGFRRGFAYSREADWNEAIRLLEEKRSRLLADLEEIRHRLEQVRDKMSAGAIYSSHAIGCNCTGPGHDAGVACAGRKTRRGRKAPGCRSGGSGGEK